VPRPKPLPTSTHRLSPNPRRHALEVISQALSPTGRGFARDLLDARLTHAPLKPADRRLAADLAYGVIRRLGTLDAVIAAFARRPLDQLEPGVRQVLRLGVYQLLFLDRVPAHAAVNESVRLARATGKGRAAGFVNALLRNVAREVAFSAAPDSARPRESFALRSDRACTFGRPILPPPRRPAEHLAAAASYPSWLVGRWLARYGTSGGREMLELGNDVPPVFIRPNAHRTSPEDLVAALKGEGIDTVPSPTGRTLRLPPHTRVGQLVSFDKGLFQVQDDASAAVAPFLDPRPGEEVLDLCAAPGGKTCHMAELMQNQGRIVAVDSSGKRLERVAENFRRLDLSIIAIVESEGANFAGRYPERFDRVLLDAPCSNTGVLRRRVEARWRLSDKALTGLVRQQRALLTAALRCLKPGGTLVYSTCSLEPEENGELVRSVLRSAREFSLDGEEQRLPERDGGDGVYMARVLRTAAARGPTR